MSLRVFHYIRFIAICSVLPLCNTAFAATPGHTHYTVIILDSAHSVPLQLARVALYRGKVLTSGKLSDINGRAQFTDIEEGTYELRIFVVGYNRYSADVEIGATHELDTIRMRTVIQEEVVVGAGEQPPTIPTIDLKTGAQTLDASNYHASPSHQITNLIQENLLGAVRAPTGEVHIKGMHGEYTYYVDGVPIPLGVFGGLNEVVDDKVVDAATLITGTIPAEYGGQSAAIVGLQNRVPTGAAHLDLSTYAGSYLSRSNTIPDSLGIVASALSPINMNGQSLSFSDHIGDIGVFLSGTRQETDRRIDSPIPYINNDHGFDYFTYAKLDYVLGDRDYLTLNVNWSKTLTQVPFDPIANGITHDEQATTNSFQTLSFSHNISREADHESDLFIGLFARQGGLTFMPGADDPHNFQFANDSIHGYILNEDRSFNTYGLRSTFAKRYSHEFQFSSGVDLSVTNGTERFATYDEQNIAGPVESSDFAGSNFGIYVQSNLHPMEWTSIDAGLRYDQQVAPSKPLESQWSPRIKWNILLDESSTAYLYYGKLLVTNNIEGLRQIASSVASDSTPTVAERDDYYEAGLLQTFDVGIRLKADVFHRVSLPGVDDQTIGSSAIKTPVNIAAVHTTGVEVGLSYSSTDIPLNGYVNASLIHAYGSGLISGGFLGFDDAGNGTDLDHDQRLSVVVSLNYQPSDWFANLTAIYGSGLANGNDDYIFKTGLLDFNQGAHTTPSWIVSCSVGYTVAFSGGTQIRPSLYVGNIFDHIHPIKGSYFSGAAWEEPRNVQLKVEIHI